MTTKERIENDFIRESKNRNAFAVGALRMLRAALKNAEIEKMKPLEEGDVLAVVSKELKKLKDSLESFVAGRRGDLADQARRESAMLESYLPAQLSDDELKRIIGEVVTAMNATSKDFGKVMSGVMKSAQNQADGARVGALVKQALDKPPS